MTSQLSIPSSPAPTFAGLVTDGDAASFAVFSPCRTYRYLLGRQWGYAEFAVFVLLNPSTADASVLDPTLRRCKAFAQREGCGGLLVANLAALRSTDPKGLRASTDIVGPANIDLIGWAMTHPTARTRIVGWGRIEPRVKPKLHDSIRAVMSVSRALPYSIFCLGTTTREPREPRHPLYVRGDQPLVGWP